RLDALRQGAAALAADQLRDAKHCGAKAGREFEPARQDSRTRAAAGRASEETAGARREAERSRPETRVGETHARTDGAAPESGGVDARNGESAIEGRGSAIESA